MNPFTLNNKRAMAYFLMPLLFSVIGYAVLYFAFAPVLKPVISSLNLIISDNKPDYSSRIATIFKENDSGNPNATTVDEKLVEMPTYGTHYARLEIESAEMVTDLYFGDSSAVLKKGVGQYIGSTIPGYGRPLLIGGHNNGQFNKLQYIKPGNIITITTNYGIYKYEVTESKIADSSDKSAYNLSQQKEQLILYTCYPFNTLGLTSKRFFVYGDKIAGPVITPQP